MSFASTAGRISGQAFAHTRIILSEVNWPELGQAVLQGLIALAVAVYVAGEFAGRAVHSTSAALGRLHVQLLRLDTAEQATEQVTEQVTAQVVKVMSVAQTAPKSRDDLQIAAGLSHLEHCRKTYLEPLLKVGWLTRTIPDRPRSSKQKYLLSEEGKAVLAQLNSSSASKPGK